MFMEGGHQRVGSFHLQVVGVQMILILFSLVWIIFTLCIIFKNNCFGRYWVFVAAWVFL